MRVEVPQLFRTFFATGLERTCGISTTTAGKLELTCEVELPKLSQNVVKNILEFLCFEVNPASATTDLQYNMSMCSLLFMESWVLRRQF